jgi:catechol 2,3-dioxygenase-like lactoylglutathione lyase family enzyme
LSLAQTAPILRLFDEVRAKEFYVEFLGFKVDWEHRFEPGLPLYMQVSKDECVLHLSEHHGDCSPGAAMRIQSSDLDAFHAGLAEAVRLLLDAGERPDRSCYPTGRGDVDEVLRKHFEQ